MTSFISSGSTRHLLGSCNKVGMKINCIEWCTNLQVMIPSELEELLQIVKGIHKFTSYNNNVIWKLQEPWFWFLYYYNSIVFFFPIRSISCPCPDNYYWFLMLFGYSTVVRVSTLYGTTFYFSALLISNPSFSLHAKIFYHNILQVRNKNLREKNIFFFQLRVGG